MNISFSELRTSRTALMTCTRYQRTRTVRIQTVGGIAEFTFTLQNQMGSKATSESTFDQKLIRIGNSESETDRVFESRLLVGYQILIDLTFQYSIIITRLPQRILTYSSPNLHIEFKFHWWSEQWSQQRWQKWVEVVYNCTFHARPDSFWHQNSSEVVNKTISATE